MLIWNRYGAVHEQACRFEREGGIVMVAENGYLGKGGTSPKFDVHPHGPQPHHYYALGLWFHNDDSRIVVGGPERFAALNVELKPWRTDGGHVLILPNRSFGVPGRMMPADWAERCAERLKLQTKRPVRIRAHPGNDEPKARPLAADLEGACAAVIWSSTAGIHALVAGIPVFSDAPHWICKSASLPASDLGAMDAGRPWDRMALDVTRRSALERMAFGQWRIEEIETGVPFRWILGESASA